MDAAMIEMVSGSSNRARRPHVRGLQAKSARQHMSDMKTTVRVLRRLLTGLANNTLVGVNRRIGIHEVFCIQDDSRIIIALTSGHNIPNGRSEIMGVDIGPSQHSFYAIDWAMADIILSLYAAVEVGEKNAIFMVPITDRHVRTLKAADIPEWVRLVTGLVDTLEERLKNKADQSADKLDFIWQQVEKTGRKVSFSTPDILDATNKGCEIIISAMRADFDKMTPLARGLITLNVAIQNNAWTSSWDPSPRTNPDIQWLINALDTTEFSVRYIEDFQAIIASDSLDNPTEKSVRDLILFNRVFQSIRDAIECDAPQFSENMFRISRRQVRAYLEKERRLQKIRNPNKRECPILLLSLINSI